MNDEIRTDGPDGQESEGRSLLVLYGSETGHSQEISEEIGDAAERMRIQVVVEQMNDVSLVSNPSIVCSFDQFQTILTKHHRKPWHITRLWFLLHLLLDKAICLPMPTPSGRAY